MENATQIEFLNIGGSGGGLSWAGAGGSF